MIDAKNKMEQTQETIPATQIYTIAGINSDRIDYLSQEAQKVRVRSLVKQISGSVESADNNQIGSTWYNEVIPGLLRMNPPEIYR